MIKAAIYFAAGVVVGAAATFFAVKGYFEKQKEDAVTEAWNDAREHFKKHAEAREKAARNRLEKLKIISSDIAGNGSYEQKEPQKPKKKASDVDIKVMRKKAKEQLRSYRRNVFTDPPTKRDIRIVEDDTASDDYDPDDYDAIHEAPSEGTRDDPYIIDADQWNYDNRGFDRETIYVYSDGVCVDEGEILVDNIENLIGKDNFDMLADLADSDGCVLIRNEMRSSDYEILLQDEPYNPDTVPVRDD